MSSYSRVGVSRQGATTIVRPSFSLGCSASVRRATISMALWACARVTSSFRRAATPTQAVSVPLRRSGDHMSVVGSGNSNSGGITPMML